MDRISTSGELFNDKGPFGTPGLLRRPAFLVLVLGVTLFLLLSACGGGGSAATPTPTQATGNVGETPTTTKGGGEPATSSGTEEYFVPATQWRDLVLNLNAGDNVKVSYTSEFRIVGRSKIGTGDIESGVVVVVTNPIEEQILRTEQAGEGTVEVTADIPGEYTFTFLNNFEFQGQSVDVEYTINP